MNRLASLCLLSLAATCVAAPNELTPEERADGWELLWDGRTTKGWTGVKSRCKTFPDHGWKIADGVLSVVPRQKVVNGRLQMIDDDEARKGGGGDIVSDRTFGDFILKVDFLTTPSANSGIKYFYDVNCNKNPADGPEGAGTSTEYQILDDSVAGQYAKQPIDSKTGALYALKACDLVPDVEKVVRPTGEWNTAMIVSVGSHVEHWLNGVKLLEYERFSPDFRARVAKSKYRDWVVDGPDGHWGELRRGHILLQDHSCQVAFRNIKVKDLSRAAGK